MKNKYLSLTLLFLILIIIVVGIGSKKIISKQEITILDKTDIKAKSDSISIMYENSSGTYEKSKDGSWPDDFFLNPEKSSCESKTAIGYDINDDEIIFKGDHPEKCKLYFDNDITLANYIKSIYVYDGYNDIYFHDKKGEYVNADLEAGDNSYRYSGGGYLLTDKALTEGYKTGYDVIKGYYNAQNGYQINDYAGSSRYRLEYDTSQTFGTLKEAIKKAVEDDYLVKNDVNNYICLQALENGSCPEDSLYRIIGVIPTDVQDKDNQNKKEDLVKLVKADIANKELLGSDNNYKGEVSPPKNYLGNKAKLSNYILTSEETLDMTKSDFFTKNLNETYKNYLQTLDGNLLSKIETLNWKIGKNKSDSYYKGNASIFYECEQSEDKKYLTMQIGIPYGSDYMYAANPMYWHFTSGGAPWSGDVLVPKDYREAIWQNWFFIGGSHILVLDAREDDQKVLTRITDYGLVVSVTAKNFTVNVQPSFYLKANVKYQSGDGTIENPFIIA